MSTEKYLWFPQIPSPDSTGSPDPVSLALRTFCNLFWNDSHIVESPLTSLNLPQLLKAIQEQKQPICVIGTFSDQEQASRYSENELELDLFDLPRHKPNKIFRYIPLLKLPKYLKELRDCLAPLDPSKEGQENLDFIEAWEQLKLAKFPKSTKPVVYVFDDYSNYIVRQNDGYKPNNNCTRFDKEILAGFCNNLDSLDQDFTVKAPPLWIPNSQPSYELIATTIPWDEIERDRSQIAAFIVDVEWLPTMLDYSQRPEREQWAEMGYRAIHLLSQKYPEIPSFLFTGIHDIKYLEQGLSYGASWCFYKDKTHHHNPFQTGGMSIESLKAFSLERHLEEASLTRYGAYKEVPFPNQFQVNPSTSVGTELFKQLRLPKPIGRCSRGQALQKLIAVMFPNAEQVEPVKVLNSGKSAAQATFFVKPTNQATRFIKIASWFSIQKEYLAYQQVIQPQLNSYTATIIRKPIVSEGNFNQLPTGALTYSLAGLPEDYQHLRSLDSLIEQNIDKSEGGNFLTARIENTLKKVLKPLYDSSTSSSTKRPLWNWLGQILPPLSGVLIPLKNWISKDIEGYKNDLANTKIKIQSYATQGYKDKAAWTLASFELTQLLQPDNPKKALFSDLSPWDDFNSKDSEYKDHKVLLSGWHLLEIDCQEGEFAEGAIALIHPDLGVRIRLRGISKDIHQRFGATWIRPGMPVEVLVCLDHNSQEVEKIKRKIFSSALSEKLLAPQSDDKPKQLDESIRYLLSQFGENLTNPKENLPNPFDCLGVYPSIPYHYTITARTGMIHGDLNLQNILYADDDEKVGWLIDFERSQADGMVAFDLAKLEVELWNHHLTPWLVKLAAFLFSNADRKKYYQLLDLALKSTEFEGDSAEFFFTQMQKLAVGTSQALVIPIANGLRAIAAIRKFALKDCKLTSSELKWALAIYFLNAAKFKDISNWSSIFAFLASAWHLQSVLPEPNPDDPDNISNIFSAIQQGTQTSKLRQKIDRLLIEVQNNRFQEPKTNDIPE